MDNRRRYLIVSWMAVLIWAALIFWFSAQPAQDSDHLSRGLTSIIADLLDGLLGDFPFNLNSANNYLRKCAHFLVYFVLGFLVKNGFRASGYSAGKGFVIALAVCFLYAVSDELHQFFVPGRGAQLSDVMLDSFGALVGIGLYTVLLTWMDRRKVKETGKETGVRE